MAAVMASGATLMRFGQDRRAADNDFATRKFALDGFLQNPLAAGHRHRRQKLAVGQLRQIFIRAADPDEILDLVVIGFEILVTERPRFTVAIALGSFEIVIAQAIRLATPGDRTPANLTSANPPERLVFRSRVRVVNIVNEEVMAVFIRRVTSGLNRLARGVFRAGSKAAILEFIRPGVFSGSSWRPASSTSTVIPCSVSTFAAHPPVAPEPTTIAS
jgi:hypothetical protein